MKLTVFVLISLAVVSFGATTKTQTLLNAQTKDAVQSALNILYDLQKATQQSDSSAQARNKTDEAQGLKNIQVLTQLVNLNKHTLSHATAYRTQVQSDVTETKNYIAWLQGRIKENGRKLKALHRERCYANALFVKAIKENQDALQVIDLLGNDLRGYLSSQSQISMTQVQDVADKLKMYAHLFKEQAVKEFSQLASQSALAENSENKETAEQTQSRIAALLAKLRTTLAEALKALEVNEIKAAYDLARFVTDSEGENRWLRDETSRKRTYLDRLNMLLTGARNSESKAKAASDEAEKTLNTAIEELRNKRYFYARERARRVEETSLIEELIRLFRDRVGAMGETNV